MSNQTNSINFYSQQGEDIFTITQFQGTAKFNRDANKKIIGVSINAMGYVLEGTKAEGSLAGVVKYRILNKAYQISK
jgi:hypothetical protein